MSPDRIEHEVLLNAPPARVWQALSDPQQFGAWFGVKLDTGFTAGQPLTGQITHPGYEHLRFTADVERVDEPRLLSFRSHPYGIDPKVDYSAEPKTLVEFRLEDAPEGTLLRVVESGFDGIPAHRRDEAWRMNDQGWAQQMQNIRRYISG